MDSSLLTRLRGLNRLVTTPQVQLSAASVICPPPCCITSGNGGTGPTGPTGASGFIDGSGSTGDTGPTGDIGYTGYT